MPSPKRLFAGAALCALLAACATPQPVLPRPDHLLHDELFAQPSERVSAADVFAVSDSLRRYVSTEIVHRARAQGTQNALIDALYTKGQLKLEYDATRTRNASEAFDARTGNCLSLVILTAAIAKELGLPVQYQSAYLEETWSRSGRLLLRSAHVNVTLGPRLGDRYTNPFAGPLTIDFLPAAEIRGLRTREIPESTIVAMFMNNRAVEAMVQQRIDDAYAWAREAVVQDPGYMSAVNTLGLLYQRRGQAAHAVAAFRHVVAHEPKNTRAMANLAEALAALGQVDEAASLRKRLAQLEPEPPFHYFNLGMEAMAREDFRAARDLFAKEVARAEYYHEFHFWLGVASYRLGNVEHARKHMRLALEHSTSRGEHELYAAKLERLRTIGN